MIYLVTNNSLAYLVRSKDEPRAVELAKKQVADDERWFQWVEDETTVDVFHQEGPEEVIAIG